MKTKMIRGKKSITRSIEWKGRYILNLEGGVGCQCVKHKGKKGINMHMQESIWILMKVRRWTEEDRLHEKRNHAKCRSYAVCFYIYGKGRIHDMQKFQTLRDDQCCGALDWNYGSQICFDEYPEDGCGYSPLNMVQFFLYRKSVPPSLVPCWSITDLYHEIMILFQMMRVRISLN